MRVHMTDPVVALSKLLTTVLAQPRLYLGVGFRVAFNALLELVFVTTADDKGTLATRPLELGIGRG